MFAQCVEQLTTSIPCIGLCIRNSESLHVATVPSVSYSASKTEEEK